MDIVVRKALTHCFGSHDRVVHALSVLPFVVPAPPVPLLFDWPVSLHRGWLIEEGWLH